MPKMPYTPKEMMTIAAAREADAMVLRSRGKRLLVYHWYEGLDDTGEEILRALLALDRSPVRRPGRALVLRASTRLREGGLEGGEAKLREFLSLVDAAREPPEHSE